MHLEIFTQLVKKDWLDWDRNFRIILHKSNKNRLKKMFSY